MKGPVEDLSWDKKLKARITTPGAHPRIHGYDVRGDLMKNIDLPALILLTLTGELPTEEQKTAFEKTMIFISPISVNEAPVHASVLAGLCGSDSTGRAGVAAITLAQQARFITKEQKAIDQQENTGETTLLLNELTKHKIQFPNEFRTLPPTQAAIAVLNHCCGLNTEQIEQVFIMARMPCAMAEAAAVKPGDFREYPIELPGFEYTDGDK